MTPTELLSRYKDNPHSTADVSVNAAAALFTGEKSEELAKAIQLLSTQIPLSVAQLRGTIRESAEKSIKSNTELSASNEKYANRMTYLTGALVFVGIVQIIVSLLKS